MNLDKKDLNFFKENLHLIEERGVVTIEKGAYQDVLAELNKLFKSAPSVRLVLVCDPSKVAQEGLVRNLDMLVNINHLRRLNILVNSSTPLSDISNLEALDNLEALKISGYYEQKMDLNVLDKFSNLKELRLDHKLANKDYRFITLNLAALELKELDLNQVERNENLSELIISGHLVGEMLLAEKFPNLKILALKNCKKINNFDFISSLKKLESLSFNGVSGLTRMPALGSGWVNKLEMLTCKNLVDISAAASLENLKRLAITEAGVEFTDIEKLANQLNLEVFYFRSKNNKENEKFDLLSSKKGFRNSHISF